MGELALVLVIFFDFYDSPPKVLMKKKFAKVYGAKNESYSHLFLALVKNSILDFSQL